MGENKIKQAVILAAGERKDFDRQAGRVSRNRGHYNNK